MFSARVNLLTEVSLWLALVFLGTLAVYALEAWWSRRRRRQDQANAEREETARVLQQQQQQAYAQSQAQLQALFNSMVEGVLILNSGGRVELINQSLEGLFQPRADIHGQTMLEAFRLPSLAEIVERLRSEKAVLGFELELSGPPARFLEVNATAILDRESRHQGAILVFHDLTRIKQLENTRREFVANVSHELRTPLSMIKGFVETLLDGAKDNPETATPFLQTIEKHTDRLTFLIEDLLTISRLESGQVVMNLTPVGLHEIVDRVVDDLHSRAAAKGARIENRVPADLSVHADADRMQQVVFNLVDNAIKYGGEAGRVTVGGKTSSDGKVELWVQDNGPGIPAEARERVFERFYRVDRARSRETGGTGLGLAIVKHIVLAHGGDVWVTSEAGQGASFHFTLPRA